MHIVVAKDEKLEMFMLTRTLKLKIKRLLITDTRVVQSGIYVYVDKQTGFMSPLFVFE